MDAFNCVRPRDKSKLPPLPRCQNISKRFQKPSLTCGITSTSSVKTIESGKESTTKPVHSSTYDPFNYDSTSMTRDLLRGFIMRRKDSLTNRECDFLENVVADGEEDDMNNAMIALSDQDLFFYPEEKVPLDRQASALLLSSSARDDSDRQLKIERSKDIEVLERDGSFVDVTSYPSNGSGDDSPDCKQKKSMPKLVEPLGNVEIIESENGGAIILENFKIPDPPKVEYDVVQTPSILWEKKKIIAETTPTEQKPRSRSVPQTLPVRLGTPHRMKRVAERKESSVHSRMWKAHKQGLSLNPTSSAQLMRDLNRTYSFKRNLFSSVKSSGSHSRSSSRGPSPLTRNNSRGPLPLEQLDSFKRKWQKMRSSERIVLTEFSSSIPSIQLGHHLRNSTTSLASELTEVSSFGPGRHSRMSSLNNTAGNVTINKMEDSTHSITISDIFSKSRRWDQEESFDASAIPGLDLATPLHESTSFSLPMAPASSCQSSHHSHYGEPLGSLRNRGKSPMITRKSPARRGSPGKGNSRKVLDDSTNSIPSLALSRPLMESSTSSVQSNSSTLLLRESSQISTASSKTLNSLHPAYALERGKSNVSTGSSSSLRHAAPMRPYRNPSPLGRPSTVKRSVSDGVVPKRNMTRSSVLERYTAITSSPSRKKRPITLKTKRGSFNARIDVLDTITSYDDLLSPTNRDDEEESLETLETIESNDYQSSLSPSITIEDAPTVPPQPVLIRKASKGNDEGLGLEIAGLDNSGNVQAMLRLERIEKLETRRKFNDLTSGTKRGLSMEEKALQAINMNSLLDENEDDQSWDLKSDDGRPFDNWNMILTDADENDYSFAFVILGTSADDVASMPHVLSPPLMESLHHFLPYSVSEQNFFMKYSLIRDGASFFTLLQNVRGSQHTVIAIETTYGEVFGSFSSSQWRKNTNYFGSGESFLWRMKKDRKTISKSVLDQAQLESDIEVFAWTGTNYLTQLCTDEKIALGGGGSSDKEGSFGLLIESNLINGSTNWCATFGNPPLMKQQQNGNTFEIVNLEVWTMTPCNTEEEAEKLEFGRLFLESNRRGQN